MFVQLPLFSGIARCQERGSFVCKHRQTEKGKQKYTSLLIKYLQTASQPLQCDAVLWQSETIAK